MRTRIGLMLLTVALAGCEAGAPRPPSLPPGVFGVYLDNDTGAINFSAWAFSSPANTRANPAEATRAVIALEYLPGELTENPRWVGIDSLVKMRLGGARDDLRRILGIRPDAPPQLVINTLLALNWNLQTGNQSAAMQVLASPVFTLPPERTLQILSDLPYVQTANLATARIQDRSFAGGTIR